MTNEQKNELVTLLWNYMKRDTEHRDRVQPGWGTKTQEGLAACIERVLAISKVYIVTEEWGGSGSEVGFGVNRVFTNADRAFEYAEAIRKEQGNIVEVQEQELVTDSSLAEVAQ